MEKNYIESKPKYQTNLELDFGDSNWQKNLTVIVDALQEHEIFKNHLLKIKSNSNQDLNQTREDENYKWGRTKDYQKQLEEFNKFRDHTLNQINGLSNNDVQEGQKIFKAVQTELYRLQEALPIYAKKSEIIDKIKNNRVVILQGNTGCGKSTQIIQYLLEIKEFTKKIALGQPFRYSLETITQRIREESGMEVGLVPEHIHHLVSNSKLNIHTHKSLIFALIDDHKLSDYSCIIVDEAHHRFIDSELIIILLKDVLDKNPDLRVIITSATADLNIFDRFFGKETPKIDVSGISHDVEIKYVGSFHQNRRQINNLIIQIFQEQIHKINNGEPSNFDGNILIFMPSRSEIFDLINKFPDSISSLYEIFPFHGDLDDESQRKIFLNYKKPKIIVSTRVGETSITIRDLKVVIDTGIDILRHFDRKAYITVEKKGNITKSSANQRAGRTGRTCPGVCYRLYSEKDYLSLQEYEQSSYKSYNFHRFITTLKTLNIRDFINFKFLEALDKQDKENMEKDIEFLQLIEALDSNQEITPLGKIMNKCNLDLHHTRILFEAVKLGCVEEVAQTLALFNRDWKLFIPKDGSKDAKGHFCTEDGDFIMLFNILNKYQEQKDGTKWANDNCLSIKALELASNFAQSLEKTINELKGITSELGPEVHQIDIKQRILKCFFMGYWYNLCRRGDDQTLTLCRINESITIDTNSSMGLSNGSQNIHFMVCDEIANRDREFSGRIFSKVDPKWLKDLPEKLLEYIGLHTQNSSALHKKKTIGQLTFNKNTRIIRNFDEKMMSNTRRTKGFYNSKNK